MISSISSTPRRKSRSLEGSQCNDDIKVATPTSTTNTYTAFEDLQNTFQDMPNIRQIIEDIRCKVEFSDNWRDHFDAIESLRILNKYNSHETRLHLSFLVDFLQKSLESLRSHLSKNSIMLIKEVFQCYRDNKDSEKFLDQILPTILEKAVSEKGFLKSEARAALKALEKTGCNNNVINVLCRKSFDKNAIISELSFQSLAEIIQEAKENLTDKINHEHLRLLFSTIARSIDGKRAVNKRVAKTLCEELKNLFSGNGASFEVFLKEKMLIQESEVRIIIESLNKNPKNTKQDLSCFIKTKKMKQETDKLPNTNFTLVSINLKK